MLTEDQRLTVESVRQSLQVEHEHLRNCVASDNLGPCVMQGIEDRLKGMASRLDAVLLAFDGRK